MNRPYVTTTTTNHRAAVGGMRILEILDSLKNEYDNLTRDINVYKLQKDDYDRKLQQQLTEAQTIQQQLMELDRNFQKMKQKYEEEISFLRRQLGANDNSPPGSLRSGPSGEKRLISAVEISAAQDLGNLMGGIESSATPNKSRQLPNLSTSSNALSPALIIPGSAGGPGMMLNGPSGGPGSNGSGVHRFTPILNNHHPSPLSNSASASTPTSAAPPMPPKPVPKKSPDLQKPILSPTSPLPPQPPGSSLPISNFPGSPKKKPEGSESAQDWIVGYNPQVLNRKLEVSLDYDLEHDSVVCCVNFSPGGKYLATGCNHSAQIYDVESGAKIHTFIDKPELESDLYIRSVCFSPDSTLLATGVEDKTVKLWDIEKGAIRHNLTGHEFDIYSLDFSPDGRLIISGSGDRKVKIWRIEDAKCIATLGDEVNGPKDGVTSVCITQDGHTIAAGSLDRIVRLWDIETGTIITQYEGHNDSVYSVAFSPDGKTLASGSLDRTVKLWDVNRTQKRCRVSLAGHRDFVLSVTFSPDGTWLVSGSKDRSVQFWDPRTSLTHIILQGHRNSVISVALTGDREGSCGKFATGSGDARARIWQWKD